MDALRRMWRLRVGGTLLEIPGLSKDFLRKLGERTPRTSKWINTR
jgi:hypothetical protein